MVSIWFRHCRRPMRGVSGPISPKPAASIVQLRSLLPHCAEQLHVHVPPSLWGIEIESRPSAVGTGVGAAVGVDVGAAGTCA